MVEATYVLKDGTKTSYYRQELESILPNRINCVFDGKVLVEAKNSGNMVSQKEMIIGDLQASFTNKENSPLKRFKPYRFLSRIFRSAEYPHLFYATPAISDENGKTRKEVGMLVIHKVSDMMLKLYFVYGAIISDKLDVLGVVSSAIENNEVF